VEGVGEAARRTRESVDDKLDRYLLNPAHPKGGPKAVWFERALGYTRANADDLASQVIFDDATAVQQAVNEHGTTYRQVIQITGANGRSIDVIFVWIRNHDGIVRLVTAMPGTR
jgi:transposase